MRKLLIAILGLVVIGIILVWAGGPDFIPNAVDEVRNLIGPQPVAAAEDVFYGAMDRVNQVLYRNRTTPGYWDVSPTAPAAPDSAAVPAPTETPQSGLAGALAPLVGAAQSKIASMSQTATTRLQTVPNVVGTPIAQAQAQVQPQMQANTQGVAAPLFHPTNFTPLYPKLAAPGEGVWVPMPNPFDSSAPPLMFKTFLHPDPDRSFARVAIVAMDLTKMRLHAVMGTQEPVSSVKLNRPGLIPLTDMPALVAAFNGGFRAIHGHYDMMVNGQSLMPPQPYGDTIALYKDGSLRIAPWTTLQPSLPLMQAYRQTPPYLVQDGTVNPALLNETSTVWGATVSRDTVIWRSALGLSSDGRTLYYGVGESLTARRMAEAMAAAGASDAAELDVNLSFERFLTYGPQTVKGVGNLLLSSMNYKPGLYTVLPATRDFFYLTLNNTN